MLKGFSSTINICKKSRKLGGRIGRELAAAVVE